MKTLSTSELVLSAVASTIKGTSFISINNYLSKTSGDTSNYLLLLGYSHENAMVNDFATLQAKQNEIFTILEKDFSKETITIAYNELYTSLEKRLSSDEVKQALREQNDTTIVRSDAQNNAFVTITNGIKRNKDTNALHIIGLEIKKTVIEKSETEKKATKSAEKTIIKNKIKKLCEFREGKIRSFIFVDTEVKMQGLTIKA